MFPILYIHQPQYLAALSRLHPIFTPSWAFPAPPGLTADMLSCSSCSAWTSLWNLGSPMEILSWEGQYIPKNKTYTFYNDPIKGKDLRHITACQNHLTFQYNPSHVCHSEIMRLAITILGSFDNLSSQSQSSRENMSKQSITRANWLLFQSATIPCSQFHSDSCFCWFQSTMSFPTSKVIATLQVKAGYPKRVSFDHSEVQKSTQEYPLVI